LSFNRIKNRFISSALILPLLSSFAIFASAEDFKQALVSAYQSNPGLMAERARVREIDENYIQAKAQGRVSTGRFSIPIFLQALTIQLLPAVS